MKLYIILLTTMLLMISCDEGNKNTVEKYSDTVVDKYKGTQQFGKQVDIQRLQEAITMFKSAEGRYPKDIAEITESTGIELDSNLYTYDPETGVLATKQ
ncbi:MAG: hypothetical protein L3V56_01295 [Candidatus Magnetoovum sp. WYHC-5]|nr:hypothetical protein [Candidatus Magnetoovum sp. WYHC-5]